MTLRSKLRIEKSGLTASSIFYAFAGGAEIFVLSLTGFRLFTLGFLGILSFTSAYGLFRVKKSFVIIVLIRFFIGITFSATTLYASISIKTFYPSFSVLLFHLMLMAYLIINLITTIYVVAVRKKFSLSTNDN